MIDYYVPCASMQADTNTATCSKVLQDLLHNLNPSLEKLLVQAKKTLKRVSSVEKPRSRNKASIVYLTVAEPPTLKEQYTVYIKSSLPFVDCVLGELCFALSGTSYPR